MRATCDNRPLGGTQRMDYDKIGALSTFEIYDKNINTKMHTIEVSGISYNNDGNVDKIGHVNEYRGY